MFKRSYSNRAKPDNWVFKIFKLADLANFPNFINKANIHISLQKQS